MPAAAAAAQQASAPPAAAAPPKLARVSNEYGEVEEALPIGRPKGPLSPRAQAIRHDSHSQWTTGSVQGDGEGSPQLTAPPSDPYTL